MTITIEALETIKAKAAKAGLANWLTPGSAESGWYSCVITGKKMRSKVAEAQLEAQAAYEATLVGENAREITKEEYEAPIAGGESRPNLDGHDVKPVMTKAEYDSYMQSSMGMTSKLFHHLETAQSKKILPIKCSDCGVERLIKPQDVFQVTRCVDCQKKHRNHIRAERRKQKPGKTE